MRSEGRDPLGVPHPLPEPLAELIAERFRVIGEPLRIMLLDRLRAGEASVGELTGALGTTQQNISRHLAVLHSAGIVVRRRQGTRVLYAIADETVFALCETVCGALQQSLAELALLLGEVPPLAQRTMNPATPSRPPRSSGAAGESDPTAPRS